MDLVFDYQFLKNLHEMLGEKKFFELFEKTYPDFELYYCSKDWICSDEYILKLKGENGDIVISWE